MGGGVGGRVSSKLYHFCKRVVVMYFGGKSIESKWLHTKEILSVVFFFISYCVCVCVCPDHPCAGKVGWERLHHLFLMTADKCGWREVLVSKQIGPHLYVHTHTHTHTHTFTSCLLSSPPCVRWHGLEKISGYVSKAQTFEAPRNVAIACFYISVFTFFEMAWEYSNSIQFTGQSEHSRNLSISLERKISNLILSILDLTLKFVL